jgi:nucleoside-diphosphate-sugar epimerase
MSMTTKPIHAVTGALGYTGKSLTEQLLANKIKVRTLTNSQSRHNPFGENLEIRPLAFDNPAQLTESLRGVQVLYNTYWVRFNHKLFTFDQAVNNTKALFAAAKEAGVEKIVHVSILHADEADDLRYYYGKHQLEDELKALDLPFAILRPGVLFGRGDILVNNIAWTLRHLPFFGTFGSGSYKLRPLHVDDMAALMLNAASESDSTTIDAVGPESYTYKELIQCIGSTVGVSKPIIPVPPAFGYLVSKLVSLAVNDVVITRQEITGLMRGLLDSNAPTAGHTKLSEYITEHKQTIGHRYANEIKRRTDRLSPYDQI